MPAVSATFPRSAPAANAGIGTELRRILGRALRRLERLAAPRCATGDGELPPEFFKFPPV
jgi:hypothetical protein